MLVELARYLLRALGDPAAGVQVDHIRTGGTDLLFLRVPEAPGKSLTQYDRDALVTVLETIGSRAGHTVVVDWR